MTSVEEIKAKVELVTTRVITKSKRSHISKIEGLHFLDLSEQVFELLGTSSERKLAALLGISKSEIHRLSKISMLPDEVKELVKTKNLDKWMAYELALVHEGYFSYIIPGIFRDEIKTRRDLSHAVRRIKGAAHGN